MVAEVAHDLGILTVGIVTKPFSFEGKRKMGLAEQGHRKPADARTASSSSPMSG